MVKLVLSEVSSLEAKLLVEYFIHEMKMCMF